jgi:hypothetical protein
MMTYVIGTGCVDVIDKFGPLGADTPMVAALKPQV